MAQEYLLASQILVAAALLFLCFYLLYLDFGNKINRAFALVLFLRAGVIGLNQIIRFETSFQTVFTGVRGYFFLAAPFALLNLFVVYNWRAPTTAVRIARAVLLLGFLILAGSYARHHQLLYAVDAQGTPATAPLTPVYPLATLLMAGFAIWFAYASLKSSRRARIKFYYLMGLGFASAAFVESSIAWATLLRYGVDGFGAGPAISAIEAIQIVTLLAPAPVASWAIFILAVPKASPPPSRSVPWTLGIAAVSFGIPFVATLLFADNMGPLLLLVGFARLLFPAIVGYAIARQSAGAGNPFALDMAAKVTIRRGTLGGIFLAAFFAFSEVSSDMLQEVASSWNVNPVWGQLIGALAALAFLLLLHPVRVLGEKMSQTAMPNAKPLEELSATGRERLYEEQLLLAWEDGALTKKERLLLDTLRDRLRISPETAIRMEKRALAASPA